jgi:Fe-S cluster biogenesis protein NfuA
MLPEFFERSIVLGQKDFQRRIQRIGGLVHGLDSIADPAARAAAKELVQVLMDLHGAGLERTMEIVFEAGESGQQILDKLGRDSLVGSLLVLYGLHPLDFETRISRVLERIRPQLHKHGCEFELLGMQDGLVQLRVQIGEHTRGSTAKTVQSMLEDAIYEVAPDVTSVVIEGLEGKTANGFVGIEKLLGSPPPAPAGQILTASESGD